MSDSSTPLTIVLVGDHGHETGGLTKVCFDSAIGLKAAGHRPIVFSSAGPIDERLKAAGIECVCMDQHSLVDHPSKLAAFVQGVWNEKAVKGLRDLLASLPRQNTIVHVHGWAKATSPAIARPIRASGLPAVYTMHDYFIFCPTGGFYNYATETVCRLEPLSGACWTSNCDARNHVRKLWRCSRQVAMEHVFHFADLFSDYIFVSPFQIEAVGRRAPNSARRHLVSNPISAENLGQKSDPATGDYLYVGRMEPEKGPHLFIEAALRAGVKPVLVGDGRMKAELEAKYPQAKFLGWKTPPETHALMRAARCLIFPSIWWEAQGLTALEAKAYGTPVLVGDECAAREAVEDGVTGLWFKSGDADDLARAIRAMAEDATVARMSAAAHADFWRNPPTPERHVAEIVAIYRNMAGRAAV